MIAPVVLPLLFCEFSADEDFGDYGVLFGFPANPVVLEQDAADSGSLVWFYLEPHKRADEQGHKDYEQEVLDLCAGDKKHCKEYRHHKQSCAEVGFGEYQDYRQQGEEKWADEGAEISVVGAVTKIPGQDEDVGEFAELGWLDLEEGRDCADTEPSADVVDNGDKGNIDDSVEQQKGEQGENQAEYPVAD